VAYSRVHTGVHWPSDVLGGLVLGSGIALVTRRW
jgi:membrane-associated phospholipid phosphatase